MADAAEFERHRSVGKLGVDRGAGVEQVDHWPLRAAEQGSGVSARGLGGDHALLDHDGFNPSARELVGERASGDAAADDHGVDGFGRAALV